ncbi:helix-turn-helix transcriptional regulator [Terrimonas pollutisoli]|uniref:helix-turn-helix transcriptional regulator n=1 Tax=Terrimonas pollutisoli TaxID=3034147 RepID=UPI0023ECA447|nr:AraC family transcriptional regulator [Terrimonas sp. H1YJ31]
MDKINLTQWDQYFGTTEQQLVHSSERYTHFTVQFQQPGLATGKLNAINTPGMLFTELFMEADQPFSLYDAVPKETAESVFVLSGDVESRFDNFAEPIYFGRQQHNIQYNTNFSGTHTIHSPQFHACTITYHPDYLNSLAEDEPTGALGLFCKHVQKKTHFLGAAGGLCWQQRMAELITAIRQCTFQGITRYIFIESKLLELFVLQMDQVHALQSNAAEKYWSAADKEKLYAVKEFIATSFLEPLSLRKLTCRFGLNEYKLKKGYKYFFRTTVFGDIHQLRMQQAKQLLAERVMNVTEVAYHIGYNNLSSFSYAFKKMFGYSPGNV